MKLRLLAIAAATAAVLAAVTAGTAGAAVTCTPTGFVRDNMNLTAVLINPGKVTGPVDATGCNIGVYYGPGSKGQVNKAEVFGANYFGIVNNGAKVDIQNSYVHDIGEHPFDGTQHGVGIYFAYDSGATGDIANNTVSRYQKGGIVVNGASDSANIHNNTVTGLGRVAFIAQNGIQVGFGASGDVSNNTVTDNAYTGPGQTVSTGLLVFGGCGDPLSVGDDIHNNTLVSNDVGVYLDNETDACDGTPPATPTKGKIHNNSISNDAVTNTTGDGTRGYQAGIVDIGNGDQISNNTISGAGYAPKDDATAFVTPIDTSDAVNPKLKKNKTA